MPCKLLEYFHVKPAVDTAPMTLPVRPNFTASLAVFSCTYTRTKSNISQQTTLRYRRYGPSEYNIGLISRNLPSEDSIFNKQMPRWNYYIDNPNSEVTTKDQKKEKEKEKEDDPAK